MNESRILSTGFWVVFPYSLRPLSQLYFHVLNQNNDLVFSNLPLPNLSDLCWVPP